jgi:hypothetical protein
MIAVAYLGCFAPRKIGLVTYNGFSATPYSVAAQFRPKVKNFKGSD